MMPTTNSKKKLQSANDTWNICPAMKNLQQDSNVYSSLAYMYLHNQKTDHDD